MNRDIPQECPGCPFLHTGGVKDGKHDRWCCQFGKPSYEAIGRCRLVGGRPSKPDGEEKKQ